MAPVGIKKGREKKRNDHGRTGGWSSSDRLLCDDEPSLPFAGREGPGLNFDPPGQPRGEREIQKRKKNIYIYMQDNK